MARVEFYDASEVVLSPGDEVYVDDGEDTSGTIEELEEWPEGDYALVWLTDGHRKWFKCSDVSCS